MNSVNRIPKSVTLTGFVTDNRKPSSFTHTGLITERRLPLTPPETSFVVRLPTNVQKNGVETRDINKSVKNNPEKFPDGYVIELSKKELNDLRWKFSTTKLSKTRVLPKAFNEKGLYMLATILKSKQATQATLSIIETFTKLSTLSRTMQKLAQTSERKNQKSLMDQTSELMGELIYDDLETTESETTFELNFAVMKLKHTTKKKK